MPSAGMKTFTLKRELWLPRRREEIFHFFADAANLEKITPPWLQFEILTSEPIVMRPGALIDYRLRLRGFPLRWRTEITEWNPPRHFADMQVRGPYVLWQHTHTFEERDGGTLCGDSVLYRPRGGALIDRLFVRRDLERIFDYRCEYLKKLFGTAGPLP